MSFNPVQTKLQVPTPTPLVKEPKVTRKTAVAISAKDFDEKAAEIKRGLRAFTTLFKVFCANSVKGQAVSVIVDGVSTKLGFGTFRGYISFYCNRITDLSTHFRASAGRRVKSKDGVKRTTPIQKLHYVKDDMVNYIGNVNKGNGLAAYMHGPVYDNDPNLQAACRFNGATEQDQIFQYIRSLESAHAKRELSVDEAMQALASRDSGEDMTGAQLMQFVDINTSLGTFLEAGIASRKLVSSIIHLVINANGLQSKDEKTRVHTDDLFMSHFARPVDPSVGFDTNYTIGGEQVEKYEEAHKAFVTLGHADKIKLVNEITGKSFGHSNGDQKVNRTTANTLFEVLSDYNRTLITSISERSTKVSNFIPQNQAEPGTDKYGITYDMIMVFTSRNFVPDYFLSERQQNNLTEFNQQYALAASNTSDYISSTHKAHKALK
jgi:hypothetical protein